MVFLKQGREAEAEFSTGPGRDWSTLASASSSRGAWELS